MFEEKIPSDASTDDPERRNFLKFAAAGVLGAAYAGLVGYPVYRYLASPVEKAAAEGEVKEVVLEDALKVPKNAALMFKFGQNPAMLIHHEDDTWTALSAVCTHLGCTVGYQPDKKIIYCPCHGGTYDPNSGANLGGPPPKPLVEYKAQIRDGKMVVRRG